ncbi:MAG: PTS transporter subunit EIIC, partial [Trichococcus flocculiformis]
MKNEQTIKDILDAVGGQDNVKNFEHCATRLRIILRDNSKVSKEKAEAVTGSKGYFFNTGQHQFIFGTGKVNEVYSEFKQYTKMDESADTAFKEDVYSNMTPVQRVVRTLADILIPLIPALVTTGLLMGLRGLLVELGVEFSPFMLSMFQMLTDTAFAFLPVLIAYSATRKFGGNPIIGIVVGLMMVSPNLPNAWAVAGGSAEAINVSFLGLNIPIVGYQGSIIPAIVAGYLISRIEKELRKVVPQIIDLIVTPFVTLTVTIFLMLFILGPITHTFEIAVSDFIVMLINAPLGIGYILFGALQQLLVITGLHHTLSIIELQLLADTG